MELSFMEMAMIVLAIIILFGPKKIPTIARDLGSGIRKMKAAMEDVKTEIMKETDNPISEIKNEIDKMKESAKDFDLRDQFQKEILSDEERKISKANELKDDHQGPVSR
ncbi:Sec-independent protein translocase subunit TatA/TatB [Frigoriflavimonas asaccharolytica]|uniref:Sec-independent protein translocase protein TatB n=1 Tax=Frigoriflavimonas asaccharolytica TaxID=2735899 RepID=A0A8J8G5V5_9FLAO|nr:twin-arginine translocase TatA/TatE family subunit [Frigoriflavimonas asaccharolytica]NRS92053.1 sec-independent protein translocase protein TatB [Frigoriflavimonas asaccharolytica]